MKVELDSEEWWPVFKAHPRDGDYDPSEVPDELWEEYVQAYDKMSVLLAKLVKIYYETD
jgi:hypothetical protein